MMMMIIITLIIILTLRINNKRDGLGLVAAVWQTEQLTS